MLILLLNEIGTVGEGRSIYEELRNSISFVLKYQGDIPHQKVDIDWRIILRCELAEFRIQPQTWEDINETVGVFTSRTTRFSRMGLHFVVLAEVAKGIILCINLF